MDNTESAEMSVDEGKADELAEHVEITSNTDEPTIASPQSEPKPTVALAEDTGVSMEFQENLKDVSNIVANEKPEVEPVACVPRELIDDHSSNLIESSDTAAETNAKTASTDLNAETVPLTPLVTVGLSEQETLTEPNADLINANVSLTRNTQSNTSNALGLLATYDSGSDSDVEEICNSDNDEHSVLEVPVANLRDHRIPVVAVSSGSESSDSSDSDSDGEYLTVLRKEIEKSTKTDDCDDDDDDDDGTGGERPRRRQPPKVRGELLLDDLPPIQQLEITVPEDECIELGKVHSIVDQLVLVSVLPNSMLFDLDTVLFLEKGRKVLGEVFDVLGQVTDPIYCVRFNSNKQILERDINLGDIVYCAPKSEHTQFVILSKLMQIRGSDASWEHDVEPPTRYIDYSDDEAEREARFDRRRKHRERINSADSNESVTSTSASTSTAEPTAAPMRRRRRGNQREPQSCGSSVGAQDSRSRSQSRDSQYNYHPSYNPGSWHSKYYHNNHPNYPHPPSANFNMLPPGMHFPMPTHGYGIMPFPYAMPPAFMPMPTPRHMFQQYGHPPSTEQQPPE
ncbi:H/ACA ribonucleoprotein complex non-core subunit NAF1 [Scaptodrosophila lebanonensis]|uniref:H/ACA ribonucleoprotein complex non-core subunit NAF1 n=1 Tax=Drosophila lebanonensis TaxID=7225 RepID=A0A6J2U6H4_DROLE|nr:H/ACA ribonucleoprotein complex non-core subunit NAF1 [Scaptodrosophila lebanonensis]